MTLVIIGTLFIGKAVAFASIPLIAIAVIAYSMSNPVKAISIFVMYAAMEGMFKYLSGYSQAIYIVRPTLSLIILSGLWFGRRNLGTRLSIPPLAALMLLLAGWSLVAVFNPLGTGVAGGLGAAFIWYLAPMIALLSCYNAMRTPQHVDTLLYAFVAVTVVVSLFTMLQYGMGRGWTEAHLPGYASMNEGIWVGVDAEGHKIFDSFRPASTTSMGGGGSQWSCWGCIIVLGMILEAQKKTKRMLWLGLWLLVLATGLICGAARLYLLATLFCAPILIFITAKSSRALARNLGVMLLVAAIMWGASAMASTITGGMVGSRYASTLQNPFAKYNENRGGLGWRSEFLWDHLVAYPLGVGYQRGTEGAATLRTHLSTASEFAENRDDEFNAISYDLGVPGLLLITIILIALAIRSWRCFKILSEPHLRIHGAIFFALIVSVLMVCFAGPATLGVDSLWIFAGTAFILPTLQKRYRARMAETADQFVLAPAPTHAYEQVRNSGV